MIVIDKHNYYLGKLTKETKEYYLVDKTRYFKDPKIFGAKITDVPFPDNLETTFAKLENKRWVQDLEAKERSLKAKEKAKQDQIERKRQLELKRQEMEKDPEYQKRKAEALKKYENRK